MNICQEYYVEKKGNINMRSRKERFICGCCGCEFQDYLKNQLKFDQDRGYGMCFYCAADAEQREKEIMDDLIIKMLLDLNPVNVTTFLSMDREEQEGVIHQAIEDKMITFSIKGR